MRVQKVSIADGDVVVVTVPGLVSVVVPNDHHLWPVGGKSRAENGQRRIFKCLSHLLLVMNVI